MQLNLKLSKSVAFVIAVTVALVLIFVFDGDSGVKLHVERGPATTRPYGIGPSISDQGEKGESRLKVAIRRSREYWGRVPCGGVVHYHIGYLKEYWGYASWTEKDGRYTDCDVIFARRVFGKGKHAPFSKFCQVLIHEDGHLLGETHNRDPEDVMYPTATSKNTPQTCKRGQEQGDTPAFTGGRQ